MTDDYREIPSLLHEARLIDLEWEPTLALLRAAFACLRRNSDGTTIEDTTVELRMDGVEAIAAYYSPANVEVRPSVFAVPCRIVAEELQECSRDALEVALAIKSTRADFDMEASGVTDWLVGQPLIERSDSTPFRIHLTFE